MTTDSLIDAAERLATLREQIGRAARLTDRSGDAINLIAVSKTHDADAIRPLLHAGQRVFGENRVQEAQEKWPALREEFSGVELHLVGQLQSNKAADAVALFDVIHSLDRPSLLTALAKAMDAAGKRVPCFIQVNIGAEEQKGGCSIADTPALIAAARDADIPVPGLMCVPPADIEAAPFFALLAKMAREEGLPRLSMGMSGDYETAIMLGATDIRVGTALFGERPSPARPIPASGRGMLRNSRAK
ncbi:YggS family pyridoxal phosphate-dependent enzyme [Sphingobium sp. WCS2017Hpa-17]|uniref:YggS family pyridoxal phosphate-dependent enzyme n=1 Tax=Sphingobium sp. WCS2017Hpa-17 TaxID=3073638 RepID=UPI00288B1292|nr:YggS family pyridoxal phosphate-dependent enzyme [Sphingobium sp. WCS2017Hpa-17]